MTGRLVKLTGAGFAADHERRIFDLERQLRVKPTDGADRNEAGLPTISLRGVVPSQSIPTGGPTALDWDWPPDGTGTVNLGGFFTFTSPDSIEAAADCVVLAIADVRWTNGAGARKIEMFGLADRSFSDLDERPAGWTTLLPTVVTGVGILYAATPLYVEAEHDQAGAEGLGDSTFSVMRLALL